MKLVGLFVQDDWKVTPNLTLNLGVRDDEFRQTNLAGEQYMNFKSNWGPRVAFNYSPPALEKFKFFGSYGRYYIPPAMNLGVHDTIELRECRRVLQDLRSHGRPVQGSVGANDLSAEPRGDLLEYGLSRSLSLADQLVRVNYCRAPATKQPNDGCLASTDIASQRDREHLERLRIYVKRSRVNA